MNATPPPPPQLFDAAVRLCRVHTQIIVYIMQSLLNGEFGTLFRRSINKTQALSLSLSFVPCLHSARRSPCATSFYRMDEKKKKSFPVSIHAPQKLKISHTQYNSISAGNFILRVRVRATKAIYPAHKVHCTAFVYNIFLLLLLLLRHTLFIFDLD